MATEHLSIFMVDKRDVAVKAFRSPAALVADHYRRESATVLENDCLSPVGESVGQGPAQRGGEYAFVELALTLVAHVDNFDIGEDGSFESF